MNHIPTPWKVCDEPKNDQWDKGRTIGAADPNDGRRICDMAILATDQEAFANAAFIVQAVNAHEGLMEALKYVLACRDIKCLAPKGTKCGNECAYHQAQAALAVGEK